MSSCYDDTVRTIVDIPDEQLEALRRLCERENISRAEAIRRAIAELIARRQRANARDRAILEETAGAWAGYGIDALEYQRKLRAEWDER